ncbi:MAG: N-formylglutamate deformylase [Planctomycetes bacterium]|nr:N-formylglutamate deformylase [Planctomycetota bacterium]
MREPEAPRTPLVVSIPHCGLELPPGLSERFTSDRVRALPDTDWHLERLYDFAPSLGATMIHARYSRYVVDLNRARENVALYPGRFETRVVPTRTFADEPIYTTGDEPDDAECTARLDAFWQPYHDRLRIELERRREEFGYALLFDAHSITSFVPVFHPEPLPGLMLGTADQTSCAVRIHEAILAVHADSGMTYRANSPFKGGYITRTFGRPHEGIHAVQLEMSQRLYMHEGEPFAFDEERASKLRPVLSRTLETFLQAARP